MSSDQTPRKNYQQIREALEEQIEQIENDINQIPCTSANQSEENIANKYQEKRSSSSNLAPHWEQVLSFIRQSQNEEAMYALVRVVQRLLDEKASKKTLNEKATKTYVDNLSERVASGAKDILTQCTEESVTGLHSQIVDIRAKIAELRKYMQDELHVIQNQIAEMKSVHITDQNKQDIDDQLPPDYGEEQHGSAFTVHPHRQTM